MGRQNVEKMRGRDTRMEIAREFTYSISTVNMESVRCNRRGRSCRSQIVSLKVLRNTVFQPWISISLTNHLLFLASHCCSRKTMLLYCPAVIRDNTHPSSKPTLPYLSIPSITALPPRNPYPHPTTPTSPTSLLPSRTATALICCAYYPPCTSAPKQPPPSIIVAHTYASANGKGPHPIGSKHPIVRQELYCMCVLLNACRLSRCSDSPAPTITLHQRP